MTLVRAANKRTGELKATIRFKLSEKGQKNEIKKGKGGERSRSISVTISRRQIDLFEVDPSGKLYFELSRHFDSIPSPKEALKEVWHEARWPEMVEKLKSSLRGEQPVTREMQNFLRILPRT